MPRYILIDNYSGYIFGDTADLPGDHVIGEARMRDHELTPVLAAQWLDEAVIGEHGRTYEERPRASGSDITGYDVYSANGPNGELVSVVFDGQDQDTIDDVVKSCPHVCFVAAMSGAEL